MFKNRFFLEMGPTNEFQPKFSGFSIKFGYKNSKNLKCVLQFNWDIDAVYCDVFLSSSELIINGATTVFSIVCPEKIAFSLQSAHKIVVDEFQTNLSGFSI